MVNMVDQMSGNVPKLQSGDSIFRFSTSDPTFLTVLLAVLAVLVTILLLYIAKKRRNVRRGVLLVGLSESGKTLLFTLLVHKQHMYTHTSIKANSGSYIIPDNRSSLRIIDLPGYERLRMQFFDQFKGLARGLIFVVDSIAAQVEMKDIAQFLYTILSDPTIQQNCPPVLIACNKQEFTTAKSCKVIQALLEKEMNAVRITQSVVLESTSETGNNNNAFLGQTDKNFEFAHLAPMKVEFADCSAGDAEGNRSLKSIEDWLRKIA